MRIVLDIVGFGNVQLSNPRIRFLPPTEGPRTAPERPVDYDNEKNPALIPPSNPADTPTINVIASGDFSEEPQRLGLNLHGDPCISAGLSSQGRLRAISFFKSDRIKSSIKNDLAGGTLFIDPRTTQRRTSGGSWVYSDCRRYLAV
jgi:hypothetical protein